MTLTRLDRPIGILLLLWPTLWALWLASAGLPSPVITGIFVTGTVLMRSAGCIINDIADRKLDRHVRRTRHRPLATGEVSVTFALVVFFLLLLLSASLLVFLNQFVFWLALFGVVLTVLYPQLKRITHLPQAGLGLAFAWGIPMAFAACENTLPAKAFWPFAATFAWILMYDTLYAMTDRPDDVKAGIRSTAILFGKQDRLMIALLQCATLLLLAVTGKIFSLGNIFFASLIIAGILFVFQQWLIRDRLPEPCFRAFLNNHWVGCVIFAGIFLGSP